MDYEGVFRGVNHERFFQQLVEKMQKLFANICVYSNVNAPRMAVICMECQMKLTVIVASIAMVLSSQAFAQEKAAGALVCSEYEMLDNAGKNAVAAELQSEASGMGLRSDITSEEIFTGLAAGCKGAPEIMIVEVVKNL